jgi:predicted RNA-binding protein with PIN domain
MNVVGSNPDGWWRDRHGAMVRLARRLGDFQAQSGDPVSVVFDGRPFAIDVEGVDVGFAPTRGRNAADDEIARRVAADTDAAALTVVTSDRELSDRVRRHGAEVMPAGAFLRSLDGD